MKDKSGGKIMTKFVGIIAKICSYFIDVGSEDKKVIKSEKKRVIKRKPKFQNYKNCLEASQLDNKIKYLEKNKIKIEILKKNCLYAKDPYEAKYRFLIKKKRKYRLKEF